MSADDDRDTSDASSGAHDPTVGSWSEEAVRLFGALSGWVTQQGGDAHRGADDAIRHTCEELHRWAEGVEEHVATGAKECTWCPVCRTIHAVRTVNPEVRTHLTAAAISLAKAAAALVAPPSAPASAPRSTDDRPAGDDRVQRIHLDDDPDPA